MVKDDIELKGGIKTMEQYKAKEKQQTKIYVVSAKDEFKLVAELNLFGMEHDVFAVQPFEKKNGSWIAFCYYKGK